MQQEHPGKSLSAADYQKRLDRDMLDFVVATGLLYPEDTAHGDIKGQRAIYDRMAAAFHAGRPSSVHTTDREIAGALAIPIRRYDHAGPAPQAAVLYLHGGGFVVGGLDSHDDVCAEICERSGFQVVSVDYRLSPEHLHPAAFDDALAATRWLAAEFDGPVVIVGDSAGANLAAAVCHALRADPAQPVGQVLIYAGLGGPDDLPSYTEHAFAPLLTLADVQAYHAIRGTGHDADPTMAPLRDTDFSDLPPTVLVPAECDPLRDDSVAYDQAIRTAGGQSVCLIQTGWLHGGMRARHTTQAGKNAFDQIISAITALGQREWCGPRP